MSRPGTIQARVPDWLRAYAPDAPAELHVSASERWDYSDADAGAYTWSGERD